MRRFSMRVFRHVTIFALLFLVTACGGNITGVDQSPTSESYIEPEPSDVPLASVDPMEALGFDPKERVFRVVVIVDTSSEMVTLNEAGGLIDDASDIHFELSGFELEMIDYVQYEADTTETPNATLRNIDGLVTRYLEERPELIPDGFMIFTYGKAEETRARGGLNYIYQADIGHINRFKPTVYDVPTYHVGLVHFGHKYASCGYGPQPEREVVVQNTSFGGECRNQDGIACVENNGYSMCSTRVNDYYASSTTIFAASTIVHETMHNFGIDEGTDHYGTQKCTEAMANSTSARDYDPNDDALGDYYAGICPFVYDNFIDAFIYSDESIEETEARAEEIANATVPGGTWTGSMVSMGSESEFVDTFIDFFPGETETEFIAVGVFDFASGTETHTLFGFQEEGILFFTDEDGRFYYGNWQDGEISGAMSAECYECASEYIFTLRPE
jgi:hypothetical protein